MGYIALFNPPVTDCVVQSHSHRPPFRRSVLRKDKDRVWLYKCELQADAIRIGILGHPGWLVRGASTRKRNFKTVIYKKGDKWLTRASRQIGPQKARPNAR
jgi:hypothetical protein